MTPMLLVSDLITARAAFACLVVVGRILLLVAVLRRRVAARRNTPRWPGTVERPVSGVVAAAQLAGAVLAVLEWLLTTGIVPLW